MSRLGHFNPTFAANVTERHLFNAIDISVNKSLERLRNMEEGSPEHAVASKQVLEFISFVQSARSQVSQMFATYRSTIVPHVAEKVTS